MQLLLDDRSHCYAWFVASQEITCVEGYSVECITDFLYRRADEMLQGYNFMQEHKRML